ncbi:Glycosyl hydrolases family 43 [Flaviramulus basaltis]|uniref:Glycosyl hydrolases family 43 n=1 Tax=Flaviramulus basaltis TaxID=369401 RepID=A0A1K2INP3_9FLAO|nr:glycoside hydrolase family 43 protein [Flaviramulus basaltis]SFZ94068.1 Glycosyl hydrolases family 43 [Flaviramulus basaltis]
MKNNLTFGLIICCCFIFIKCKTTTEKQTDNSSFKSGKKWLDTNSEHINAHGGGIMFHEGVYYWFGEHKTEGRGGNTTLFGVRCYSSTDLYHWKNEGIALQVVENLDSEITKGAVIERPKVVFNKKTGKYVMWFHLELKGQGYNAARTGVAISDSPTGPFKYIKSFRPNAGTWPMNFKEAWKIEPDNSPLKWWTPEWYTYIKEGGFVRRDFESGQMSRDMTVFVDDDEKAYHIHSSEDNLTLHISELTDDYLDFTDKWITLAPAGHNEAPAIFKDEDTYYMITSGCTGWDPNEARSFKAKSIWGPWESLGNPSIGKDAELTFNSQSTYILPVEGKEHAFIFMADRWTPTNPIDGTYVWLPIEINQGKPVIKWYEKWDLNFFNK